MKSSYLGVGVIGLALAGLWFAGGGGTTPPAANASEQLRVAAPLAHENLTIYFVHGPNTIDDSRVVGLQEAIEKKWVVVHETGEVNQLTIENTSADRDVFVQSGDMIRGGKQDRLIAADILVRPGTGKLPVPSHCVEHGRWTGRGGEATTHFNKSDNFVVGNDIKLANANRDQSKVWQEVAANQSKLRTNTGAVVADPQSPTSLQLTLENPAVQAKVAEYERTLKASGEGRAGVVGVVFVVNGKVSAAEVYGSSGLFQKAWPKLLRSASVEAIADKKAGDTHYQPSCREVELFLASAATAEPTTVTNDSRGRVETVGNDNNDNVSTFNFPFNRSAGGRANPRGAREVQVPVSRVVPVTITNADGTTRTGSQVVTTTEIRTVTETVAVQQQLEAVPSPLGQGFQGRSSATSVRLLQSAGGSNPQSPVAQPQAANPSANPLNTNRVDNRGSLMLESRDATQQNAVIHRSYIKK